MVPDRENEVPLIGRQRDLETLLRRLQQASQSGGQVLLLAGDSGVGKTRLALEVLHILSATGATMLLSTAYEQEGKIPYRKSARKLPSFMREMNGASPPR